MVDEGIVAFSKGLNTCCQVMVVDASAKQLPFRERELRLCLVAVKEQAIIGVVLRGLYLGEVSLSAHAEGGVGFCVERLPVLSVVGGLQ